MKRSIFDRRIPTLLAVVLLIGGLITASYLANTTLQTTSQASPDEKPQNVRITNITDSHFTLTYTTSKAVLGTLTYGISQPSQPVLDDRDQKTANPKEYTTHAISVSGLKPKTTYAFSITSVVTYTSTPSAFLLSESRSVPVIVFASAGAASEIVGAVVISKGLPLSRKTLAPDVIENA